jgi:hypothetical protein
MNSFQDISRLYRVLLVLLPLVSFTFSISALEITDEEDYFSLVCVEDSVVGFNWVGGSWKPQVFKPGKFLIHKIGYFESKLSFDPPKENPPKHRGCFRIGNNGMKIYPIEKCKKEAESKNMEFTCGCYISRTFGQPIEIISSVGCKEYWSENLQGIRYIDKVICDDTGILRVKEHIIFSPNGKFHKTFLHDQLKDVSEKDSLSISVGECTSF